MATRRRPPARVDDRETTTAAARGHVVVISTLLEQHALEIARSVLAHSREPGLDLFRALERSLHVGNDVGRADVIDEGCLFEEPGRLLPRAAENQRATRS